MDARHSNALRRAIRIDGNEVCVDCFVPNPTWASTNLGVFLCIKCAGVHRSMGTHISKVKSLSLDKWDDSMVRTMQDIGNFKSNSFFLALCPANVGITENANGVEREAFIRDKYIQRRFAANLTSTAQATPSNDYLAESSSSPTFTPAEEATQIRMPKEKKGKVGKSAKSSSKSSTPDAVSATSGLSMFDGLSVTSEQPETAAPTPAVEPLKKTASVQRRGGASPWVTKDLQEETKMPQEVAAVAATVPDVAPMMPIARKPQTPAVQPLSEPVLSYQAPAVKQTPGQYSEPTPAVKIAKMDDLLQFDSVAEDDSHDDDDLLSIGAARESVRKAIASPRKATHASDDPFADILGLSPSSGQSAAPMLGNFGSQPAVVAPASNPSFPFMQAAPPNPFGFDQPGFGANGPMYQSPPAGFPFMQPVTSQPAPGFPFMQSAPPMNSTPSASFSQTAGPAPSGFGFINNGAQSSQPSASTSAFGFM